MEDIPGEQLIPKRNTSFVRSFDDFIKIIALYAKNGTELTNTQKEERNVESMNIKSGGRSCIYLQETTTMLQGRSLTHSWS
jgi:hypothetical protein